jgi:L-seryl-tRNA(Ser) seleniumtransferase
MKTKNSLRAVPSVEKVLQSLGTIDLPRPAVVAVVRRQLTVLRSEKQIPDFDGVLARVRSSLGALRASRIQTVINGTGVIVHTNFGRSPLGPAVVESLQTIGANYNNLEFDLGGGERGGRAAYLEHNLALLCGGAAATVVNNCAAALVLILRHFTSGERKEIVISRGELIQIGGGFRIPEILEATGATLREIGTTNKTLLGDYRRAIGRQTAMILKVHRSNFFMGGFVESPPTEEISALAKKKRLPFVEDLGSGAVVPTEKLADIEHEPTPEEVIRRGVDLVCFSSDKLLGGPQAGIIVGRAKLIAALKKEPFFRALRCDKLILSALQTTVDLYLNGRTDSIPALNMLRASLGELLRRAKRIVTALEALPMKTTIGAGKSQIGGGTLPRSALPSVTLDLLPLNISLSDLATKLRGGNPPVVGYLAGGRFKLDLRTVFPRQDEVLFRAVYAVFGREVK